MRGPRQVGKTTLLKLLIRALLDGGTDPRAILYYRCDRVASASELDDLVETYLRWQAPFRLPRRYLFLDEVSSVRDWAIAIRALSNRGRLRGATVLLTGSHALDVTRQVERLPGRRGEGANQGSEDVLDKVLPPMKFAEYAETLSPDIRRRIVDAGLLDARARRATLDAVFEGRPSAEWSEVQALQEPLERLFADYLVTGGFPRPLNDLRRSGRIARETYELYVRALAGDLARWGHAERTARELLAGIVAKVGTPVSWRTLAAETDIGSHNTVAKYVETLERTFVVQTVYQYDHRRRRRAPRKDRKVYVSDPFLFHAIRAWALGLDDPFEGSRDFVNDRERRSGLLEAVVADHLARIAFAARPGSLFDAYEHVLFWRSRKGWEVDFVLRIGERPRAFQVAARARPEARRALRAFGGGLMVTERGDGDSVPIAPFLLLA